MPGPLLANTWLWHVPRPITSSKAAAWRKAAAGRQLLIGLVPPRLRLIPALGYEGLKLGHRHLFLLVMLEKQKVCTVIRPDQCKDYIYAQHYTTLVLW